MFGVCVVVDVHCIQTDYAVEDDRILVELFDALGQAKHTEQKLMSSTLPDSHQQIAQAAGFVPDPTFTKDQRRQFLFYPLTSSGGQGDWDGALRARQEGWRVSLIDTMGS